VSGYTEFKKFFDVDVMGEMALYAAEFQKSANEIIETSKN
jgi:hypothetical protein